MMCGEIHWMSNCPELKDVQKFVKNKKREENAIVTLADIDLAVDECDFDDVVLCSVCSDPGEFSDDDFFDDMDPDEVTCFFGRSDQFFTDHYSIKRTDILVGCICGSSRHMSTMCARLTSDLM